MSRSVGHGRLALVLAAFTALLLACATPAGAATGFLTDETLTSATTGTTAVAMAPNGYAIVAWIERPSSQVVRVSVRPPGGAWSAPETFPVSLDSAFTVGVAIASSGAAAVAWEEVTSPSTFDVAVVSRSAGGAFTAPEILREGVQTFSPAVGIDAAGTVTLLYAPSPRTVVRDFPAGASALAARPQELAASCAAFNQHLAVAPSGDAVAGYDCSGAVFALRRAGSWAVSPTVPDDNPGGSCPSPTFYGVASVAIDAAGEPVGVLRREHRSQFDLGGFCQTFSETIDLSLVLPLGGLMTAVPGPPAATAMSTFGFGFPVSGGQAAVSPAGIVLAWGDTSQLSRAQQKVRFFAADGSAAGAPQPVGVESTGVGAPALAVSADGRALLAWLQSDRPGGTIRLLVAERPPGGTFGDPAPVDAAGAVSSAVALSEGGDGLAAWMAGASAPYALHVRGYDAAAPTLSGVTVPASATVGTPAAFSASPFDVWGPLTTTWSFGDGATATGAAVTHAFARAGDFAVTVTATDAVGNAAAQSGTVRVAATAATATAPRLTGASLTHRTFRVGRQPTPLRGTIARRRRGIVPVGTTFRFTLDRAANVRIGFARRTLGVRDRAGQCVRRTRRLAGRRRCTLYAPDGTLVRSAPQGRVAIPFSGRVGRRALAPGRYRAGLTAAVGGRSAKPTVLSFRVVR